MIEIYHWEDDPDAERLLELLDKKGLKYEATLLDAENPNSRPSATYQGKTYWELDELWTVLMDEQ